MANRQAGDDSPRQGNRGVPEMEDSPRPSGGEDRVRGGSEEEVRDIGGDDVDEFEETDELDEDEEEDEGSI